MAVYKHVSFATLPDRPVEPNPANVRIVRGALPRNVRVKRTPLLQRALMRIAAWLLGL